MTHLLKKYQWDVFGASVQGALHVRNGLPNQDAIHWDIGPGGLAPAVLAVSDGHGSAKSFRSDVGSHAAVQVATDVCREFIQGLGQSPPSYVKNAVEQQLPARIAEIWRQKVTEHFKANPFSAAELDRLGKEAGTTSRQAVEKEGGWYVAYGATLLVVAITDSFVIYLQIGDGDILIVSDSTGEVSRALEKDEDLIANETTSLCMKNAAREFKSRFQLIVDAAPALLMASTDGYANSFRMDSDFLNVGPDLLDFLGADGPDAVKKNLKSWLDDASKTGSGDDVTVGVIYRLSALSKVRRARPAAIPALAAPARSSEPRPTKPTTSQKSAPPLTQSPSAGSSPQSDGARPPPRGTSAEPTVPDRSHGRAAKTPSGEQAPAKGFLDGEPPVPPVEQAERKNLHLQSCPSGAKRSASGDAVRQEPPTGSPAEGEGLLSHVKGFIAKGSQRLLGGREAEDEAAGSE